MMPKTQPIRHADRHEKNVEFQNSLKQRKQLRTLRARINAAMAEATRMKKSKKKGCADFDENMAKLGFKKIGDGKVPEQKYGKI
jgi:hypothetical protein